ncbi:hypothetical protein EWM64_g7360 [Hericium alpestre]|uniref:Uncharacterized protein n=1 Tax=Hericium alpestre TaxID=135208 RepID=A0A4Y9ZS76_9AGAM|nr:hypothetical protein EWM64_g7360 [Hericium alpestre]
MNRPLGRNVSKAAQHYDAETITFIATKTDDISCAETIDQLGLAGDPDLQELEERYDLYQVEIHLSKAKQTDIRETREEIIQQLQATQEYLDEQKQHLTKFLQQPQKRKGANQALQSSAAKRLKVETASTTYVKSELDAVNSQSTFAVSDDLKVTQEKITKAEEALAVGQMRLDFLDVQDREVTQALLVARAENSEVDKEKRTFCSVTRSEHSCALLQEGFKRGLMDFHLN